MFKDIDQWKDRKLRAVWLVLELLYFVLMAIVPIVVICIKYHLFENAYQDHKLNGFLLVLIIIVGVISLRALKKLVSKLPDTTIKQQWFKYVLQTILAILWPAAACFVLMCFKDDFNLAFDTFSICLGFFTLGLIVDNLFISFLDKERFFRQQADEKIEINKRMNRPR